MALIDRNTSDMKKFHSYITLCLLTLLVSGELHAQHQFSATEQAVISVPTPGLFTHSNAFEINFTILKDNEYSFPLPVGKAEVIGGQALEITTTKGDAVKAMFAGTVRMARDRSSMAMWSSFGTTTAWRRFMPATRKTW